MICWSESLLDGSMSIVGEDGHFYTAEEHADLLEEQAVERAHELLGGADGAP
jgi:hypothetical protein